MSAASAGVSATRAAFQSAGDGLKKAAGSLWGAAKSAATGTKEAFKAADNYVASEVAKPGGSYGKVISGIYTKHPVSATVATVGAVGGLAYGGYKVVGHFTGREAERQASRSRDRDR